MVNLTYSQKLKDPRWQRKRLEALDLSEWACDVCFDKDSTLHVHHKQYIKGKEPWEYDNDQLAVPCEACHTETHLVGDRLLDVISRLPIDGMKWIDRGKAACLIAGIMGLESFVWKDDEQEIWFRVGLGVQATVNTELDQIKSKNLGNS